MDRSRRGLLVCSAGALLAGCSSEEEPRGTQTTGVAESGGSTSTRTETVTDSSPATRSRSRTPGRFERPDARRTFGEWYVDGRTEIGFRIDRPQVTETIEVDGETHRTGEGTVLAFAPVTFENRDDESLGTILPDVFRLVTGHAVADETDDVLGVELDDVAGVEQARLWASHGTTLEPGRRTTGVAAFQLAPPVDPDRAAVALDRRRLYRDDGEHGVVAWSSG